MELKEVQEFIKQNAEKDEVKNYVKGFITPDGIKTYLDSDDGNKLIQPKLDMHFTKSLETWKANNLKKLTDEAVNTAIKEKYPEETAEQKRIKQLEKDFITEKESRVRSEMTMKAITEATQKGLPVELVTYFVGKDDDSTKAALQAYEKVWKETLTKAIEEKFKKLGRTPEKGDSSEEGLLTKEEVSKMSVDEIRKNMDKVKKSQARW